MKPLLDVPQPGQRTLLIPAMLDDHFPLLQYAFHSRDYFPVILDQGQGAAELGLRYAHNDMCYPFHLSLGQYLLALGSGAYDLENTVLLMPSAGDACRGSNFTSLIRKALVQAGYPQVQVLTLNVKGLEKDQALPIHPDMVWRALFGLFWGDLLMLLTHQTRPWEAVPGAAEACRAQWTAQLAEALKTGRGLTLGRMRRVFALAAADFAKIPLRPGPRRRVALVGELYTKYCSLGNWDVVPFLEGEGWEVAVNGFSWYLLYYGSNQVAAGGPARPVWEKLCAWMAGLQQALCQALRDHGFLTLPPFPAFQREAADWMNQDLQVADGWLIGAEAAAHIHSGCRRVLAMQPFGCLPGHVCGRGQYAALIRRLGEGKVMSVDVDASLPRLMLYNRVKLLLEPWEDAHVP